MNTSLPAVTAAATLAIAGCSFVQRFSDDQAGAGAERSLARHIEIEVEDLERGLPCRVVDRRSPDSRDILWRAEFEAGFCRQKAEETRHILEARGWACRPQSADERRGQTARPPDAPHVVAAWRCLEGLKPLQQLGAYRPPVPEARPDPDRPPAASWGNEPLRAAVKRDLSVIGQDVIGDETIVDAALGDLDGDDIEDAVVVLTRDAASSTPHRMLMAYLQNGDAYNLVDVWILDASNGKDDAKLDLTIEDGAVHLETCCGRQAGTNILVLDNRKLAYANGS